MKKLCVSFLYSNIKGKVVGDFVDGRAHLLCNGLAINFEIILCFFLFRSIRLEDHILNLRLRV
jgi:hypothetical protein